MQRHAIAPSSATRLAEALVTELELHGSRKVPLGMVSLIPLIRFISPYQVPAGESGPPFFLNGKASGGLQINGRRRSAQLVAE
jgi:hypothetical protein